MTQRVQGWIVGLAGLGMILHLLSGDIHNLEHWSDLTYPAIVSGIMEHFSAVITAFIGGNLVPNLFKTNEDRVSDAKRNEIAGV